MTTVTITRDQAVTNTFRWTDHSVPYDQDDAADDGIPRFDCSSYVARCLELPNPDGWSTVNLPNVADQLDRWDELQPADLIGNLGPGTAGDNGHVMMVVSVLTPGQLWRIAEQTPAVGPTHRNMTLAEALRNGYLPHRPKGFDMSRTDEIIASLNDGVPSNPDGSVNCPVVWEISRQSWQGTVDATLTELRATLDKVLAILAADNPGTGPVADHTHTPGGVIRDE